MLNVPFPADGEAMPAPAPVRFEDNLAGLTDLYIEIDKIAETAHTPDEIMDAIGEVRSLLRSEITNRPAITDADVAAKLRLAAHLISDPASIWPEDAVLLSDAITRLSVMRPYAIS